MLPHMTEEVSRYDWLDESPIADGGCLTLVSGVDAAHAAWAFGGDHAKATSLTLADAFNGGDEEPFRAALVVLDGWILVAENNGWQGSRPEVLRRLTASGTA